METSQNSDQVSVDQAPHDDSPKGYCVNVEGTEHPWERSTITTEEIAQLGGWDPTQGVVQIDIHNNEHKLEPGEVVQLQPGHGFCRRVRWKRGFSRTERIGEEIELLRGAHPSLIHQGAWVRIPDLPLPTGWNRDGTDVVFQIAGAFPAAPPYGIFVPSGLRFEGKTPGSYKEPSDNSPPFGGKWGFFSWAVDSPADWQPTAHIELGANLLQWVRSFSERFAEGA